MPVSERQMNAWEIRKSLLKAKPTMVPVWLMPLASAVWEPANRAELSELARSAPAYGRPSPARLVPSRGNTGVVDRARLTRERLPRYRQRLHCVGRGGAGC